LEEYALKRQEESDARNMQLLINMQQRNREDDRKHEEKMLRIMMAGMQASIHQALHMPYGPPPTPGNEDTEWSSNNPYAFYPPPTD
jgi:hypothetical protein